MSSLRKISKKLRKWDRYFAHYINVPNAIATDGWCRAWNRYAHERNSRIGGA